ncbi:MULTISPECIES: hypothetical protein [Rhizobium]|uniref:Uncharacterized protein n=1 Tax=Rhizobium favelukesii TaxID=348824 RepID=W6RJZ7_9HYPH|nr:MULTISPECIES: hypothetical protein [Rhizobium]MCA0806699.1 hypothetical protein [Rhizobium sp. T1473]MCS0462406.1 hypothetical protein [Rhizobium favelukesii]UFS85205.1 hypothetical protein LPB79_36635 [Rhizobium sp. T136]CDM61189.1 hypothetical protein LPU83_pLPU83c_0627 [Rhizobium favelukesii]
MADDIRPQLANLISRHRALVVVLGPIARQASLRDRIRTDIGELSNEEQRLRADILAWSPRNEPEAREKLIHLASFVAATGVSFEAESLDAIVKSVERFF